MDFDFFTKLNEMGFDGTGYKYKDNDLIGGYVFICFLNGKWTEIDFERGNLFINRIFNADSESSIYIEGLLNEGHIEKFETRDAMFT